MKRTKVQKMLARMQIISRRLVHAGISGDYRSAFKGAGMEFHQLREYQPGDDVRHIDWYSAAKTDKLMVRQFVQERDRQIILLVDVSASTNYSSTDDARAQTMLEVVAGLATMAQQGNDNIGLILFSDHVEKYIPPRRGPSMMNAILEAIYTHRPVGNSTDMRIAFEFLMGLPLRDAIVFVLSDWIDDVARFGSLLRVAARRYDLISMRFLDSCEYQLPGNGMLEVQDPETNRVYTIRIDREVNQRLSERAYEQRRALEQRGADHVDIVVGKPFINTLLEFFQRRIQRTI